MMSRNERKVFDPELVARVRSLYKTMGQREVAEELGLTQSVVWRLMRNHKIRTRPSGKRRKKKR